MKPELILFSDLPTILPEYPVISIAGAGGKTTLMFSLAQNLPGTVVTTTTTKVGKTQITAANQQLTINNFPPEHPQKIIWASPSLQPQNEKIIGCTTNEFSQLAKICKAQNWSIMAETDGAAQRHLKAPAAHEPVIPQESNVCFYVAGLDTINRPLNREFVHRPEIFSELTGLEPNKPITAEIIAKMMDHPQGGMKNTPSNALRIAYLTHADTDELIEAGLSISRLLQQYDYVCIH